MAGPRSGRALSPSNVGGAGFERLCAAHALPPWPASPLGAALPFPLAPAVSHPRHVGAPRHERLPPRVGAPLLLRLPVGHAPPPRPSGAPSRLVPLGAALVFPRGGLFVRLVFLPRRGGVPRPPPLPARRALWLRARLGLPPRL